MNQKHPSKYKSVHDCTIDLLAGKTHYFRSDWTLDWVEDPLFVENHGGYYSVYDNFPAAFTHDTDRRLFTTDDEDELDRWLTTNRR